MLAVVPGVAESDFGGTFQQSKSSFFRSIYTYGNELHKSTRIGSHKGFHILKRPIFSLVMLCIAPGLVRRGRPEEDSPEDILKKINMPHFLSVPLRCWEIGCRNRPNHTGVSTHTTVRCSPRCLLLCRRERPRRHIQVMYVFFFLFCPSPLPCCEMIIDQIIQAIQSNTPFFPPSMLPIAPVVVNNGPHGKLVILSSLVFGPSPLLCCSFGTDQVIQGFSHIQASTCLPRGIFPLSPVS